jgi:shikimate dehydrogenase
MIHVKKAFVIGHPIKHSRSPLIHGTWLAEHAIEGSYEAIDVAPEELPAFVGRLRDGEFAGGNVTIPHKEAVFALCDEVDPLAQRIGAANTLVRQPDGCIRGFNTDYMGFLGNLDQNAPGWDAGLGEVIVLGAGGAARAIVVALEERFAGVIHVLNRTREKAEAFNALSDRVIPGSIDEFGPLAPFARLVVNTTSIGMHGTKFDNLPLDRLTADCTVTDIVYTPLITPLLADAKALGLTTVDGLGMLLHQAVPGFEAWFGVRPEVTPALRAKIEATL